MQSRTLAFAIVAGLLACDGLLGRDGPPEAPTTDDAKPAAAEKSTVPSSDPVDTKAELIVGRFYRAEGGDAILQLPEGVLG